MNTTIKRPFVDFAAVKAAVSITQILEHYGIPVDGSRTEVRICCPIHGGTNPNEFGVNTERSIWKCFSKCGRGGNIFDYVSMVEDVDIHGAALLIDEWFSLNQTRSSGRAASGMRKHDVAGHKPRNAVKTPPKKPSIARASALREDLPQDDSDSDDSSDSESESNPNPGVNPPLGFALKNLETNHHYLVERGISQEAIEEFGVGYCSKGSMAGRIVVPIQNREAQLLGYIGRWPGDPPEDRPKYKFPNGFKKSLELFNIHRALACPEDEPLVVVEGVFDVIHLWECGIRRCVALMGSTLADAQARLILETLPRSGHVDIFFDEDDAGRNGRTAAATKLAGHCYVRVIGLPKENLQPDDLSADELTALFE